MRYVYFVLVKQSQIEQLVTLHAFITDKVAYKDYYMAHVVDAANEEILFYESHTNPDVLKNNLEACIEEYGYIIFVYKEHSFPAFQWYV